mmetsp:Transcript_27085/g.76214  ORF Transcript_27085/g.76214 Transcript_27085/m.76214 type:complete len:650 (+) Transcript_27085:167-2116(+)
MATVMNNFFSSSHWQRLPGGSNHPAVDDDERERRRRQAREEAARSKQGIWGPTHSYDSSETSPAKQPQQQRQSSSGNRSSSTFWFNPTPIATREPSVTKSQTPGSHGTESTKSASSTEEVAPTPSPLANLWNNAQMAWNCQDNDTTLSGTGRQQFWETIPEVCSPCQPRTLNPFDEREEEEEENDITVDDEIDGGPNAASGNATARRQEQSAPLGIARMQAPDHVEDKPPRPPQQAQQPQQQRMGLPPSPSQQQQQQGSPRRLSQRQKSMDNHSTSSNSSPAERRRQRYRDRMARRSSSSVLSFQEEVEVTPQQVMFKSPRYAPKVKSSPSRSSRSSDKLPINDLTVKRDDAINLDRTISELTMRSSYGEATARLSDNRRMAYYAVGRHHRHSGRGGNRRCYFTGKLILGGTPFYAGSVQQGLRTLVVFCLPSAMGLPKNVVKRDQSVFSQLDQSMHQYNNNSSSRMLRSDMSAAPSLMGGGRAGMLQRKRSGISRLSSIDDTSLMEEDMDVNWGLDKEYLLSLLEEPNETLLSQMASRYPAQFETLPEQVRSPHCWRLFVKFCFFSGLPIAEGELHYKVVTSLEENYGEEIALSHEVMEAVNGDSAEILRLPNQKTFKYLQKHYSQQSSKLPKEIFQRQSWEMVHPEV